MVSYSRLRTWSYVTRSSAARGNLLVPQPQFPPTDPAVSLFLDLEAGTLYLHLFTIHRLSPAYFLLLWLHGRGHPLVSIACLTTLCHSARSVAFHLSVCRSSLHQSVISSVRSLHALPFRATALQHSKLYRYNGQKDKRKSERTDGRTETCLCPSVRYFVTELLRRENYRVC